MQYKEPIRSLELLTSAVIIPIVITIINVISTIIIISIRCIMSGVIVVPIRSSSSLLACHDIL